MKYLNIYLDNVNIIYVTDFPKKNRFHIKRRPKENDKKFDYLVHKTIKKTTKKYNKNVNNSSGSEIFKSFIGKKRENKQKYLGIKNVEEKLANENILYCLKCAWKFPDEMSEQRRNIHVYKCFEGKGDKDIIEFTKEQKF